MAIIYRLVKGSALTHAELDNNFSELVASLEGKANSADMTTALDGKMDSGTTNPGLTQWLDLEETGFFNAAYPDSPIPSENVNVVSVVHTQLETVVTFVGVSFDNRLFTRVVKWDTATSAFISDSGWKEMASKDLSINTQTSSYTLVLTDRGGMVRMNVASANTLTVPPNSAVAFPVGTQIVLTQAGAGQTTVVAGSGVTINASGAKMKLTGQWSGATLVQVAANQWTLLGDLSA